VHDMNADGNRRGAVTLTTAAPVRSSFGRHALAPKKPRAPDHLRPATAKWWRAVQDDYELEPHHIRLLTLAAESWDRTAQAREVLDRDGITYLDRFGAPRSRPEVAVERDSRLAFARLLRELDLDVEPPAERSRPPGLRSNRRS
jgi:phage terminase small subunit